jgi:hypothetical protein
MIDRKYLSVFVAAFVLAAAASGATTVAVLSDSQTVSVQLEPGNVSASVVDNEAGSENATGDVITIEEVDGTIVALEPADKTVSAGEKAEYDVVVRGAEGIAGYGLFMSLDNSNVAAFEDFEPNYEQNVSVSNESSVQDDEVEIVAGTTDTISYDNTTEYTLGTITVNSSSAGEIDLTIGDDTTVTGTNTSFYYVGANDSSQAITRQNGSLTATND